MGRWDGQIGNLPAAFEGLKADYAAAKSSRFRRTRTGLPLSGGPGDYHYRNEADYLRIMEYARDMDRNDQVVSPILETVIRNTLQEGLSPDPQTGDTVLDADLWQRWHDWSQDPDQCDFAGEHNFRDLTALAFRGSLVDGDQFGILDADTGAVQAIEAHRVRTPTGTKRNVVLGVLLDEQRRRLEYWVTKDDVDLRQAIRKVSEIVPVPARDPQGYRNVVHLYHPKRVSQTRGVSAFAPVFDTLGQYEDIQFAKLVQQQIVSCFAIFREMESEGFSEQPAATGAVTTETLRDGTTRRLEGVAPGMEITGAPGEKLHGFSPSVPNSEYFEHVRLTLTMIGINLGLPLVLVLMDASETNFSGWRGAFDQAKFGFRRNQGMLVDRWYRPVYQWKLRQWMSEDAALRTAAARSGISVLNHIWNKPTWPYIEPYKDAQADLLRVRNGLTSWRRLHAERSQDWEEVAMEIVADNAFAIRLAKAEAARINQAYPKDANPVGWRELISLPMPDGVRAPLAPDGSSAFAEDDEEGRGG